MTEIVLQCNRCKMSRLSLGKLDLGGRTQAEKWGAVIQPASDQGWNVRIEGQEREAICPACLTAQDPANFPPYSGPNTVCPKCLTPKPGTRFCRGNLNGCKHGAAEHLHRVCSVCLFDWAEAPAESARAPSVRSEFLSFTMP